MEKFFVCKIVLLSSELSNIESIAFFWQLSSHYVTKISECCFLCFSRLKLTGGELLWPLLPREPPSKPFFISTKRQPQNLEKLRHGICYMFYNSEIPEIFNCTRKTQKLWHFSKNWKCRMFFSYILNKLSFFCKFLVKNKVAPVILRKITPEFDKFHRKGNFLR